MVFVPGPYKLKKSHYYLYHSVRSTATRQWRKLVSEKMLYIAIITSPKTKGMFCRYALPL